MTKHFFLIDDQSPLRIIIDWPNWRQAESFSSRHLQSREGTEVDVFADLVSEFASSRGIDTFYVITDSEMGEDKFAGAKLLELLLDKGLVRGVVYSSNPSLTDKATASGKCAAVTRETPNDVPSIKAFFEEGIWPKDYKKNVVVRVLSEAIHRLDNALLPLRSDIETLAVEHVNSDTIESVWNDYFGNDDQAYLNENCMTHVWCSGGGAKKYGDICQLFKDVWAGVSKCLDDKHMQDSSLISDFEEAVKSARNQDLSIQSRKEDLRDALDSVLKAGEKIVKALRKKRQSFMEELSEAGG